MTTAAISKAQELLGAEAESLLSYQAKGFDKNALHLPGPDFIDRTLADARASGVVKTMFGRRRLTPELNSRDFQRRSAAEREAVNMPIQGTAADILKKAMIDLHRELPAAGLRTRMILTVHDELLFESPREEADRAAAVVRERMENAVALAVPLTVDVGIGENWRDAKS